MACPEARIALIGATALAFHLPMTWRMTADIDLILAISDSELDTLVSVIPGWQRNPKYQQRWNAPNNVCVDLVPAPPDALDSRRLVWPKTKEVMTSAAFASPSRAPCLKLLPGSASASPPCPSSSY
jgi:hypothetical protein